MGSNYLDKILKYKREELAALKRRVSLADVRSKAADAEPPRDFLGALKTDGGGGGRAAVPRAWRGDSPPAIIAEVKKASPSAGLIRADFDPLKIARIFEDNGAAALSVLTDEHFFQGSLTSLEKIRSLVKIPLLRKDFTFDEYPIYEARAAGADAILLIIRCLQPAQFKDYAALAEELGMVALVEVHKERELEQAQKIGSRLIGINNRDLDTLEVNLETSLRLAKKVSGNPQLVAESGFSSRADLEPLLKVGIHAFLVGEALLKATDPGKKLREFS